MHIRPGFSRKSVVDRIDEQFLGNQLQPLSLFCRDAERKAGRIEPLEQLGQRVMTQGNGKVRRMAAHDFPGDEG